MNFKFSTLMSPPLAFHHLSGDNGSQGAPAVRVLATQYLGIQYLGDIFVSLHENLMSSLETEFDSFMEKSLREFQRIQLTLSCDKDRDEILNDEQLFHTKLTNDFTVLRDRLQAENDRRTAFLRKICTKHDVVLSERLIQTLVSEHSVDEEEFEILDNSGLERMDITKVDRKRILKLVKLHQNEELKEAAEQIKTRAEENEKRAQEAVELLKTENREIRKRAEETEKRSELKDSLFSLQQEKTSLIMKLRESPEKSHWLDSINYSMNIQTATADELEQAVNDLENENLEITQIIEHQKVSLQQRAAAPEVIGEDGGDSSQQENQSSTENFETGNIDTRRESGHQKQSESSITSDPIPPTFIASDMPSVASYKSGRKFLRSKSST